MQNFKVVGETVLEIEFRFNEIMTNNLIDRLILTIF